MHIVLVTLEYPTESYRAGGMGWAFAKLAKGLSDRGHRITVVVRSEMKDEVRDEQGHKVRRYKVDKMLSAVLRRRLDWRLPVAVRGYDQAVSLYLALDDLDREESIDVILAAVSPDLSLGLASRRWPWVCRISSHWPLMSVSNFFPQTKEGFWRAAFEEYGLKQATKLLAPSRLHQSIYNDLGFDRVEHLLTPVSRFDLSSSLKGMVAQRLGEGVRYLVFYGSLQGKKGAHIFADALVSLLKKHAELHVVWIGRDLVAPGWGSMVEHVQRTLQDVGPRNHLLGVVDQAEAFAWMAQAEWVILPSIMDNLPNTLLEAMMLGRPVLVTRRSGTDDMIEDGVNGVIVEPNDVVSLAQGLERALSMDEADRGKIGRCARETVEQMCDPSRQAQRLEAILSEACDGRSRRSFRPTLSRLFRVAWNLHWAYLTARYCLFGVPRTAVRTLEKLCRAYLPGYQIPVLCGGDADRAGSPRLAALSGRGDVV